MHAFDGRTDRQTDGRTDERTEFSSLDRFCIPCSAVTRKSSTYQSARIAVGRQWTVRRTTYVIVGRFQSFLRCWSTSVKSATHIYPSNGLCREFYALSKKTSLLWKRTGRLNSE